jgi:hypothetical protein
MTVGAVILGGTLIAHAGQQSAAETQPNLVEDFNYPGAAAIAAADNVVLVSGDGHILFADCNTGPSNNIGLIKVHSTDNVGANHDGLVCFQVTASTGHLELKLPAVYEIRGDGQVPGAGHKGTADLTTDDGTHTTVTINPSGSTPVGIGANPTNAPTTLLALNVTG